jgi:hypothetical protein
MPLLGSPLRHRALPVGVACAAALTTSALAFAAAPATAATASHAAAPTLTPLTASVFAPPRPATGTDGRRHLVYEVVLRNVDVMPVDVTSMTVRVRGGRTLQRIASTDVPTLMSTASGPAAALAPGQSGTVWLDVTLPRSRAVPRALVHRLTVRATLPTDPKPRTVTFDTARTRVLRRAAAAIASPLHGGLYLNFNGCCGMSPHRTAIAAVDGRAYLSERFASDFIRIDAHGIGGAGDLTRNESFFTFGQPVYAVGDGRVVSTREDLPENTPLNEPPGSAFTADTILGNDVVVRLDDGRYAAYGHLMTGSVRVRPGQRVHAGQVIARVGNTGMSGGAHLHFQLSDGAHPIASDGLPYALRRFSVAGAVTNIEAFLTGAGPADIRRVGAPSVRRGQMPLHGTVVRFPG